MFIWHHYAATKSLILGGRNHLHIPNPRIKFNASHLVGLGIKLLGCPPFFVERLDMLACSHFNAFIKALVFYVHLHLVL